MKRVTAEQEQAIASLSWADHPRVVDNLRLLAGNAPAAFRVYLERFGEGERESLIDEFTAIAACDEEAALRVLRMPFLGDDYGRVGRRALEGLERLAEQSDLDGLLRVLNHPELGGEITYANAALAGLLALEQENSAVGSALRTLPWVEDGITYSPPSNVWSIRGNWSEREHELVTELVDIGTRSAGSALALAGKPWVRDGIASNREFTFITRASDLSRSDGEIAAGILEMPFLDSASNSALYIMQTLADLADWDLSGLLRLLFSPALEGGIEKGQDGVVALLDLEIRDPAAAAMLKSLGWVKDGIDPSERNALVHLRATAVESRALFRALVAKPWAQDGLTADETEAAINLANIANRHAVRSDEAAALRILEMPFLEEVTSLDAAAVRSLSILVWEGEGDLGYLPQVLAHPSLRDGITDDRTNVVAVLGRTARNRPDLLDTLLDAEQTISLQRRIMLPLRGEIVASVIWPGPSRSDEKAALALDLLERAVRQHEAVMGVAYPRGHVITLVADVAERHGGGGPSSIISTAPPFYDDYGLVAHEAAHTYWPFFPIWIAEGAATFMDGLAKSAHSGAPLPEPVDFCLGLRSLSELDDLPWDERAAFDWCNYRLGSALFYELRGSLGDDAFQQAFGDLYLLMRDDPLEDECAGVEYGVCYVRAAFVDGLPPEEAAIAAEIINRRYYGASS